MKSRKALTVALFGGSFNPPHAGHYEIARRVAKQKKIDQVWILPVWRHPFKKRLVSFERRISLCRKFFWDLGHVKIKSYEKRPGATGYTIDLLTFLKKKFPRYRFTWVMGSDTYRQRGLWRDFKKIRKLARLILFPRGPRSPIPDISSTALRGSKDKPFRALAKS